MAQRLSVLSGKRPARSRAATKKDPAQRVLFIEFDSERAWSVASIGPAFIGAYLRAHGHIADLLRVPVHETADSFIASVAEARPDLIGVSLTSRQWLRARALIAALRQRLPIPVVAGGLHPTYEPEAVLAAPGFDYVCLGEGEDATLELLAALRAGQRGDGIANLWVRGGPRPPLRPPFEPLDALPFAARDLLDEHHGVVHMTTQRGCPFPCTYCAAPIYNELYRDLGNYGRRRSHDSVIAELRCLCESGSLTYVIFLDDTFTIHHPWVREFCRRYGEEIAAPFSLHARVETVTKELLEQLAAAGCHQITYGVESGSERVRRQILRRPVTNQRFRDVFRWTQEAGIALTANYMLGIPGETRDDMQATLALADELPMLDFGYFVFYPFPGTDLFQLCRDNGYLPADYLDRPANHRETQLALPGLTREDVAEFYDKFTALRQRKTAARLGGADAATTAMVNELAETG